MMRGEPRGIERALLEIKIPGAALLGEQFPLQPVGEAGDGAGECFELLVEEGAQPLEFLRRAKILGGKFLVMAGGVDLVAEGPRVIEHRGVRPPGLVAVGVLEAIRLHVESLGLAILRHLGVLALLALAHLLLAGAIRLRVILALVGAFCILLIGIGLGLAVIALAIAIGVLALQVERTQDSRQPLAEQALILGQIFHLVEHVAGPLLDPWPPEIDELLGGLRRLAAGQALANHERQRILERRLLALGDIGVAGAVVALDLGLDVIGQARHAQ